MNDLHIQGQVLQAQPLRYTPAGIAVCEITLQHQSVVEQAAIQRQLDFSVEAIAMGDVANYLAAVPIGSFLQIQGFIAPLRKSSSRLVLHIQEFQNLNAPPSALV
ncbi:primosomal replication protein N [Paenalcaligenes hermetiae]|uniref:Replication restart protein PriB n=1 Tax=Paenalcaligenes hermetiae TaxID=1157987 RepID=A0ABP9M2B9_9BURK